MSDLIKRLRKAAIFHPGEETQVIGGLLDTCKEAADALERIGWNTDMDAAPHSEVDILICSTEGIEIAWWSDGQGCWVTQAGKYPLADPHKWMHLPPE